MAFGAVLQILPAPSGDVRGLFCEGCTLWACDVILGRVFQLDLGSGRVRRFFSVAGILYPFSLAGDGARLWLVGETDAGQLDPSTGATIRAIPLPLASGGRGGWWDGRALWHTNAGNAFLYRLDPRSGSVMTALPTGVSGSPGVTSDGGRAWLISFSLGQLYQVDARTGTLVQQVATPAAQPVGVAYDGRALYLAHQSEPTRIYKVSPN